MDNKELDRRDRGEGWDEVDEFLKYVGLAALVGGGLFAYWMYKSPKAKTFIGGGLAATGAKMI
ncbi:MAG: hypothetical protein N2746_08590, partial [Deltaproteobacteria bacterium]|nr:hypothetical protein [Deltaproteobacteria bacterium]